MVTELALEAVLGLLTLVLNVIPDATFPSFATDALDSFATMIGGTLGGLDGMLPISEIAVFIGWTLGTYVPIVATYKISMWVWAHIPIVGTGG